MVEAALRQGASSDIRTDRLSYGGGRLASFDPTSRNSVLRLNRAFWREQGPLLPSQPLRQHRPHLLDGVGDELARWAVTSAGGI